ncbi:MAG: M56 family metallopeptidase [Eubacteriales bacterium]
MSLEGLFLSVLNQSLLGSFVIIAVVIARFILKKTHQPTYFPLWSLVLLRLLLPFSLELPLEGVQQEIMPITVAQFYVDTKYSAENHVVTENDAFSNHNRTETETTGNNEEASPSLLSFAVLFWCIGMMILLFSALISVYRTKKLIQYGSKEEDNVYLVDHLYTPFVWGILKPKIYLPSHMTDKEKNYVLAHERYHIQRFDHITRLFACVTLMLHWFNPLVWLAFRLAGKDMELSVDEGVIKNSATMDEEGLPFSKGYAETLLLFATKKKLISPLAFGQGDIQERIVNIMSTQKKSLLIGGICTLLVLGSGVGFAYHSTQPKAITEIIGSGVLISTYDYIHIPGATGMYFTEFPELKFVLDEKGNNTYHPDVLEYNEKVTAKWEEIDELTSAPREIDSYIRKEGKSTVVEIAGYYTNDDGEQVEYRDEMVFDFLFDQGYEHFSSKNRDYAPEVIEIPSSFEVFGTDYVSPEETIAESKRHDLAKIAVNEFTSYPWIRSATYSFLDREHVLLSFEIGLHAKDIPPLMTEEELSVIGKELTGFEVEVLFAP